VSPARPIATGPRIADAHGWRWYGARVAVALFVLALVGLLWVLHRQELEEKRSAVIRDVLWVEQNVRFSLARDEELLGQLGAEADALEPRQIELRMDYLLQNSSGLVQVLLVDEGGRVRAGAPGPVEPGREWVDAARRPAHDLARSSGGAAYAPPYRSGQDHLFEVFVPYYRGGRPAGSVLGCRG